MQLPDSFLTCAVCSLVILAAGCSDAPAGRGSAGGAGAGGAGAGGSANGGVAGLGGAVGGCPRRELFANGNFDAGGSGWTEIGGNWQRLIVPPDAESSDVTPESGGYFARLGGYAAEGAQQNLIGTVEVPPAATDLVFSMYSIVTSAEKQAERRDSLFVALDSDLQYVEEELDNTQVHGQWQRFEKRLDAMAAGKTLVLLARAENDAAKPTTFYLDSLSLTATVCP